MEQFIGIDVLYRALGLVRTNPLILSASSYPGDSGSPVLNENYEVVGVLSAGNSMLDYGVEVPRQDILDFLLGRLK